MNPAAKKKPAKNPKASLEISKETAQDHASLVAKNLDELQEGTKNHSSTPTSITEKNQPVTVEKETQSGITAMSEALFTRKSLTKDVILASTAFRNTAIALLLVLFIVIGVFTTFGFTYAEKIFPNVYIGKDLNVGGLTKEQASLALTDKLDTLYDEGFTFTYKNKSWVIQPEDIEFIIDADATIDNAWSVGRGSFLSSVGERMQSLTLRNTIAPVITMNDEKLTQALKTYAKEISDPEANAKVLWDKGVLSYQDEKIGNSVNVDKAKKQLKESTSLLNKVTTELEITAVQPTVFKKDIQEHEQEILALLSDPFTLTSGSQNWKIPQNKLAELLEFKKDNNKLSIELNKDNTTAFFQPIKEKVHIDPENGLFEYENGLVKNFAQSKKGADLDIEATYTALNDAIIQLDSDPTNTRTLPLVIAEIEPKITESNIADLGIQELIGEATTAFEGSPSERKHNIKIATERVHGHLYAPGEVISFNDSVGTISAATGYQATWVILGNRTVKGDGGGVCQVSTTFFQAGLNTGFPIVMRRGHSYRVKYYEKTGLGIGYDATVYSPSQDLKFKNDFASHVLVQAFYNGSNSSVTFKFYGTKDGRKVSIAKPQILSTSPAPPAEYIDNPALCPAKQKQVDFPVGGANILGGRTIIYADGTQKDDVIRTNFQAWSAKYERCPCGADAATTCNYDATPSSGTPTSGTPTTSKPTATPVRATKTPVV
ncbi:MAG: VanW family protein [bacterium]